MDVAEFNSKEKAAEVLRKHGAADETILTLSDGTTVPAINLEMILKKNLDAVEHVMVVGSGMNFLSCILTLKTKGSEAAARGEDPASLGPAKDDLSGAALSLAQQHASEATTVLMARTCSKFRSEGLLPLFAKANTEIKLQAQQVLPFLPCCAPLVGPASLAALAEVD